MADWSVPRVTAMSFAKVSSNAERMQHEERERERERERELG